MRKTLLTLTALAGLIGVAAAPAKAAPEIVSPAAAGLVHEAGYFVGGYYGAPAYAPAQYYGGDWRAREWRHRRWVEHRRWEERRWHHWHRGW